MRPWHAAVVCTCKHAPKAPEVEGIVVVLEVHEQLRTLEVSRGNADVVPDEGEGHEEGEGKAKRETVRVTQGTSGCRESGRTLSRGGKTQRGPSQSSAASSARDQS